MNQKFWQWIWGAIIGAGLLFIFLLYLISNYSPLYYSTESASDLGDFTDQEATSAVTLDLSDFNLE